MHPTTTSYQETAQGIFSTPLPLCYFIVVENTNLLMEQLKSNTLTCSCWDNSSMDVENLVRRCHVYTAWIPDLLVFTLVEWVATNKTLSSRPFNRKLASMLWANGHTTNCFFINVKASCSVQNKISLGDSAAASPTSFQTYTKRN